MNFSSDFVVNKLGEDKNFKKIFDRNFEEDSDFYLILVEYLKLSINELNRVLMKKV